MYSTDLHKVPNNQLSQSSHSHDHLVATDSGQFNKACHGHLRLPAEFLLQMMSGYLKGPEFATLTSACKRFIDITHSKHLWKIFCRVQNPISYPRFDALIYKQTSDVAKQGLAWQRLYGCQYQGVALPWKQLFNFGVPGPGSKWTGLDPEKIVVLPNGNIVISGAMRGRAGGIWSSTGQQINQFMHNTGSFEKIVVLPNGNFVTYTKQDFVVRIWDPSGHVLANLEGHTAAPTDIALLPNGTIVTVAEDGLVCMWSLAGKHIKTIIEHAGGINSIAVLPDGGFVTGSSDRTAIIWSDAGQRRGVLIGHIGPIESVAVLPRGYIVTRPASQDETGGLWSLDGRIIKHFDQNTIKNIVIMPNGGFVSTFFERGVIWSEDGELRSLLDGHKDRVLSIDVFPDGRIVTGSRDKTVRIWSSTGDHLATLQGNQGKVWCVKALPNGDILTGGNDGKVRQWTKVNTDVLVQITPPWNAKKFTDKSTVCVIS